MTRAAEILSAIEEHVSPHLQAGVAAHILQGQSTGRFLQAVFDNDLAQAAVRADPVSLVTLPALMRFLHNDAPSGSWGSPQAAQAWRDRGGYLGALQRSAA